MGVIQVVMVNVSPPCILLSVFLWFDIRGLGDPAGTAPPRVSQFLEILNWPRRMFFIYKPTYAESYLNRLPYEALTHGPLNTSVSPSSPCPLVEPGTPCGSTGCGMPPPLGNSNYLVHFNLICWPYYTSNCISVLYTLKEDVGLKESSENGIKGKTELCLGLRITG